jgi:hypothetical protein
MQLLRGQIFPYAYWLNTTEPESGLPVPGLGSHQFYIFNNPVRLEAMEITRPVNCCGGRPQEIVIEGFSTSSPSGEILFEGELPWTAEDTCQLKLPEVPLLAVSQRCHWRTSPETNFSEWHPTRYTVPFNIFEGTRWFGEYTDDLVKPEPPAPPIVECNRLEPRSGGGLTAWTDGRFVTYRSPYLHIGFSLRRPRLSFFAWDGMGTGRVEKNFLVDAPIGFLNPPANGPWRRHLAYELPPQLWTGSIEVQGQTVRYLNLKSTSGCTMNVEFDLSASGFALRIQQHNDTEEMFLEADAWRWSWDGRRVYSLSTMARPLRGNHRNGLVEAQGGWHCTGQGVMSFTPAGTPPVGLQVDTSGFRGRQAMTGLLVGVRPEPWGPVTLMAGEAKTELEFTVTNLEPELSPGPQRSAVSPGLHRAWGTQFAFRPEHGGFSNNSFGVNAENCLYLVADLAPYTKSSPPLPSMTQLLKYTLELAVRGGPGYACFLDEAHDTAPSQLISAGRVYQVEAEPKWVQDLWPFLARRVRHILANRNQDGFYVCHRLSGNSASYHTSCNAWDTFCFGHADGYSGALAYRALRNAAVLARIAGDDHLAAQSLVAAQQLQAAFVPTLFNPETGWLAGWRSADGALHDHAMHSVTALAAIYGLLTDSQAHEMLSRLEKKRLAARLDDFRYGLAPQFAPVPARDHHAKGGWHRKEIPHREDGADTYGVFTNGGISPVFTGFYLRALSQYGFQDTAERICNQLLASFDEGLFEGCLNGAECYTLDGMPSGYEGTLAHCYHVLLAIAQHKGWLLSLEPEWWPAD